MDYNITEPLPITFQQAISPPNDKVIVCLTTSHAMEILYITISNVVTVTYSIDSNYGHDSCTFDCNVDGIDYDRLVDVCFVQMRIGTILKKFFML